MSVDPLASKYPFYTPYQFAGNMPIKFIDLDGLEPAENPDMNKNVRAALADVLTIGSAVNSQNNRENYPNVHTDLCGTYSSNCILGGLTRKDDSGSEFMSDTNLETAEKFNNWVNLNVGFLVSEENAGGFQNFELHVVNELMQNFMYGTGPENYIFEENGIISSKMLDSDILENAVLDFKKNEYVTKRYSFGIGNLFRDVAKGPTPFGIDGFVGSGTITIIKNEKDVKIRIFNITSLTSGALMAKVPIANLFFGWPKSYVRDNSSQTQFGNISQTFQLSIPIEQF